MEMLKTAIEVLKQTPFDEIQRAGYNFQVNDFWSPLNDVDFLKKNYDLLHRPPLPGD